MTPVKNEQEVSEKRESSEIFSEKNSENLKLDLSGNFLEVAKKNENQNELKNGNRNEKKVFFYLKKKFLNKKRYMNENDSVSSLTCSSPKTVVTTEESLSSGVNLSYKKDYKTSELKDVPEKSKDPIPLNENQEVPRKVPVLKIVEDNKNLIIQNHPELILREKLKKDFFSPDCKLSLQEMLAIIKNEAIKKASIKVEKEKKENGSQA